MNSARIDHHEGDAPPLPIEQIDNPDRIWNPTRSFG